MARPKLSKSDSILKNFLEEAVDKVNRIDFIELDPIQIPHSYTLLQDQEISGFFSAILAWGNRKTIINKAKELMELMDNRPYDFILNHSDLDKKPFLNFKHRTFQATDILYFLDFFQRHYKNSVSLETAFYPDISVQYTQENGLNHFYKYFFDVEYAPNRTRKHIASPAKKSTCKRLNMYLRWMVRNDERKVDLGLWKTIPASELMIPLDVHVERVARKIGLLDRKQRDWFAVCELTGNLKKFDAHDPVKYDYALFGLGVEKSDLLNRDF
jgi:uncharacterized protein (TIGR02757 family)